MASNTQPDAAADRITALTVPDVEMAPISKADSKQDVDPFLVIFNPQHDAGNPKDWPTSRKWAVTDVLSATGFIRIMVSTIMAPALGTIAKELDMNSAESVMALSIYLLATAFGPLVIGPLSEIYGRQRILHASNVWFLVWNIACGFASTKGLLIAARFLAGFGASSVYALAGGVLGDVWSHEQRGRSLGMYLLIPLLGAAVGPIIGGFMAARTTWRWMFWSTSIFQAVMILVSFASFRETYAPVILRARAEKLRRETGDQEYKTLEERLYGHKSALSVLGRSLTRPVRLLAFHPIIQISAVISAFYYGILYILLSTLSTLWVDQYHQSVEISGLHYIACALGEIAGSQIGGPLMDYIFRRMQASRDTSSRTDELYVPEFRIPLMFPGAFVAPFGLLLYGWTAQYQLHWLVVDVGVFIVTFGMQIAGMPLTAYVIDAYGEHTSSAAAAQQFLKSLTAFLFPLFAPKMFEVMGYGWGSTSMALAGLSLGFPAPLILWYYGARLRAKAGNTF
ncbi:putative transporter [Neonectria ditissima]|uniref:Putative transporter n=1 Tax=Neonectria ditissima TaxID=78410 RepID=A0A0P7BLM0_9HYPO|nr:putative transporter [Neonectria ditissima]